MFPVSRSLATYFKCGTNDSFPPFFSQDQGIKSDEQERAERDGEEPGM